MKPRTLALCAPLLLPTALVAEDFHLSLAPVADQILSSAVIERVTAMDNPERHGALISAHIEQRCAKQGYHQGAANLSVSAASSTLKSITSTSSYLLTYQCY